MVSPVLADRLQLPAKPVMISPSAIPVCYDFGCKSRSVVSLSAEQWTSVAGWFNPASATPKQERAQIKNAIGWMEVIIGQHTPTHRDLALSLPPNENMSDLFPGQQDCIDEAVNTTNYLRLFEHFDLLQHHEVIEEAYRKGIFNQHWAAQIREKETENRYVVDSWFQPNGYLPVIQTSEKWEDLNVLNALFGRSERENE